MAAPESKSTQNSPRLRPPSPPAGKLKERTHPVHKTLSTAANLANLLPTGTVLAFRTLTPSFTNNGSCQLPNQSLSACLIAICAVACFFSCFTDSFVDCDGKLYYGIATFRGFYIFNAESYDKTRGKNAEKLLGLKIAGIDFVHAFVSLIVFFIFAFSDSDVQRCFLTKEGGKYLGALKMNLPLGAGVLSSFLFVIFPTTRKGIGYAGMPTIMLE